MGVKRALIVDDSKSARTFLSRILEKYDIDVDSAENAEAAIEYLGHNRPDVIFMDHLMPGMDGLQAVQAIKNNPRTAMIPIMMYTSQEGELYLGQARALGAVGVLPKQIRQADVSKVLYQLHLVPDRRTAEQSTFRPVGVSSDEDDEESMLPGRPLTDTVLREHVAELRRVLVASLDSQTERLLGDVRGALEDIRASTAREPPPPAPLWPRLAAAAALVIALAGLVLWRDDLTERRALSARIEQIERDLARAQPAAAAVAPRAMLPGDALTALTAAPVAAPSLGASSAAAPLAAASVAPIARRAAGTKALIESVPYGEDPLGGRRLELMRALFERLGAERYRGTIEIRAFAGRFCLMGNSTDGFSLAPEETPYTRCDVVGSPSADDSLAQPARMPLALADLIEETRAHSHGGIDVQVLPGDAAATVVAYPPLTDTLTAGEWNRAAGANNRIEIRER